MSVFILYSYFKLPTYWWKSFGNSDYLYSYTFFQYLEFGGSIQSFVFPPSLYFFPDLFISLFTFYILKILSLLSVEVHFTFTIVVYQLFIVSLFYKILIHSKDIGSNYEKRNILNSIIIGISLLNLSLVCSDRFLDLILFTNHSGVVLLILGFFYANQKQYTILSILLVFLGCISDPLFVGLIILFSIFQILRKQKIYFHLTIIFISLLGFIFPLLLKDLGWLEFGHEYFAQFIQTKRFNMKNINSMLNIWNYQLRENWMSSITIFLLLFLIKPKRNQQLDKFLKLFVYSNIIIAICYSSLAVYLPMRYLPMFSFYFFWRMINAYSRYINYFIAIVIVTLGFYHLNQLNISHKDYVPTYITNLEILYDSYPDSEIYLDYWYARPVYLYSHSIPRINIYQVDKKGEIYNWISEKKVSSANKSKIYVKFPLDNRLR